MLQSYVKLSLTEYEKMKEENEKAKVIIQETNETLIAESKRLQKEHEEFLKDHSSIQVCMKMGEHGSYVFKKYELNKNENRIKDLIRTILLQSGDIVKAKNPWWEL